MEPGIYPKMTRDEYDDQLSLNQSTIKVAAEKSLLHAYESLMNPKASTSAMIFGRAFHKYCLEPSEFTQDFAPMPVTAANAKVSRTTAKGATIWDEWEDDHRGKEAIKQTDLNQIVAMREGIMRNKDARAMIEGQVAIEASFFWDHPEYDFECKGQFDLLTTLHGWTVVADIKSCEDASQDGFEKAVASFSYMIQHAWYLEGLNAIQEGEREFRFIAVEKSHPYLCAVYQLDPLNVYEGKYRCDKVAKQWDRALETDTWPGYPGGTNIARSKKYAMSHEREEYEDYGEAEPGEGALLDD